MAYCGIAIVGMFPLETTIANPFETLTKLQWLRKAADITSRI